MRTILTILALLFLSVANAAEGDTLIVGSVNTGMIKIRCKTSASQNRWALIRYPKSWLTNPTKKYIIVWFWHGSGEAGSSESDLTLLSSQGLPRVIRDGNMPDSFYNFKTGRYMEVIFIAVQQSSSGTPLTVAQMQYVLNTTSVLAGRVDTKNIFHTGLSLGARQASNYLVDGVEDSLMQIRGIVAMSSPAPSGTATLTQPNGVIAQKTPIYLLWDLTDAQSPSIQPWNKKLRDTVNKYSPRQVSFFNYTSSPPHGGWINQYHPNTRHSITFMDGVTLNVNVIEWMLYNSYNASHSVNAGPDKNITLPTNFVTLYGQAEGTSSEWAQITGPNTASINSPFNDTTTVTGLVEGVYTFRLRSYNGDDFVDDLVTVTVNPEPVIPPDPPDTLPPGIAATKPGSKRWLPYRKDTAVVIPVEDTVVARVFFSRNALTQFGWKNIPFSPGPHSSVVTGFDSLTWRKITFSTMSTARWVKPVGGSYTAAATGLGENVANPSFYFPATTLSSCFYSTATRAPGEYMLEIGGLEAGQKYQVEIMASHNDADVPEATRECYYILTDNSGDETSANYNVKGNTANAVIFTNKIPVSGKFYLIANPVSGHPYGYLAAIRITKLKP